MYVHIRPSPHTNSSKPPPLHKPLTKKDKNILMVTYAILGDIWGFGRGNCEIDDWYEWQKGPGPILFFWVVVCGALWNIGVAFGHEPSAYWKSTCRKRHWYGMMTQGVVLVCWWLKAISPVYTALIVSYLRSWDIAQSNGPTIVYKRLGDLILAEAFNK